MVICLDRGADLHMAQLMPLPLIVSCFSKIQFGFAFLVPAHPGSPGKRAVKRVCVCVCFRRGVARVWRTDRRTDGRTPDRCTAIRTCRGDPDLLRDLGSSALSRSAAMTPIAPVGIDWARGWNEAAALDSPPAAADAPATGAVAGAPAAAAG